MKKVVYKIILDFFISLIFWLFILCLTLDTVIKIARIVCEMMSGWGLIIAIFLPFVSFIVFVGIFKYFFRERLKYFLAVNAFFILIVYLFIFYIDYIVTCEPIF